MSTGALTQLAAVGSQDQYLSVQGEVTFWKGVYRRHTNFAKETVRMDFNQTPHLGQKCTCTISRTGDLLSKVWLQLTMPPLNETTVLRSGSQTPADPLKVTDQPETSFGGSYSTTGHQKLYAGSNQKFFNQFEGARYCDEVGHAVIRKIELVIGGTVIDTQYGHYMQVFNELTQTPEKKEIARLIGRSGSDAELQEWAKTTQHLYVPLNFFFTRHLVQSLPLIALQYHEVKIECEFSKLEEIVADTGLKRVWTTDMNQQQKLAAEAMGISNLDVGRYIIDPTVESEEKQKRSIADVVSYINSRSSESKFNANLLCNLVYLEEEERRTFAGSVHEYLVDLLQFQGEVELTGQQTQYQAYFNHPTSELIWTIVPNACLSAAEPFNYSALDAAYNYQGDTLKSAKLQFNGYDRFQEQPASYFRELVPSQYHTSVPTRPIYVYSFALEPEDFRPSGSVNLSRVDNVKLILNHCDFTTIKTEIPVAKQKYKPVAGDYIVGVNAKGQFYTGQSLTSNGVLTDTFRPSTFTPSNHDDVVTLLNRPDFLHTKKKERTYTGKLRDAVNSHSSVTVDNIDANGNINSNLDLIPEGAKILHPYIGQSASHPALQHEYQAGGDPGYFLENNDSFLYPGRPLFPGYPVYELTESDVANAEDYYYVVTGASIVIKPGTSQSHRTRGASSDAHGTTEALKSPEENPPSDITIIGKRLLFKNIPEFDDPTITTASQPNGIKGGFGIKGESGTGHFTEANGVVHPNKPYTAVTGAKLRVYARSKNVLRIKSGMAGLAYAN